MIKEEMISTAEARTLISTTRSIAMGLALTQNEYFQIMMIYGNAVERIEMDQDDKSGVLTDREAVEQYIKQCNYTWTVDRLVQEYRKKKQGRYVSYTAEDCIKHCEEALKRLSEKEAL